ncbi:MAG: hypothetical protein KKF56_01175 [Nanoarchaeota archaeon]|nr:hypothetical protein [Nanoarchaeota archaeon]
MDEQKLKEAFSKIKKEISQIKDDNITLRDSLIETLNHLSNLNISIKTSLEDIKKQQSKLSTQISKIKTTSTHNATLRQEIEGSKPQDLRVSTGNEGVSTDRQTDTPTDNSTHKIPIISSQPPHLQITQQTPSIMLNPNENIEEKPKSSSLQNASEILENLDNLKKEVRLKIKRLTNQEMRVFSLLYQLDDQQIDVDYEILSKNLNLTQSSIRDYIQRIITKGIPINKEKINNKKIVLHVSPALRKIATLDTILKLREI